MLFRPGIFTTEDNVSKPNKQNRNNYTQAGRLTPDDMARERKKMGGSPAKVEIPAPRSEKITARGEQESNRGRSGTEE